MKTLDKDKKKFINPKYPSEGWITIYRKLVDWQWYKTPNMVHFFIHLLLKANHKDNFWEDIKIKRGQFITGRNSLAKDTGMSVQSVRTCIKRLKSTKEITIKSTKKYTIITISNFDKYQFPDNESNQVNNQEINHQVTKCQPSSNQVLTTNNNEYNDNNVINNIRLSEIKISDVPPDHIIYFNITLEFWELFKKINIENEISTTVLDKANYRWVDQIRLSIDNKEATIQQLRDVYNWLKARKSKNAKFWSCYIRSTKKLREKLPILLTQMKLEPQNQDKVFNNVKKMIENERNTENNNN